jgi:vacuolar-type H+-ATPase subunit I/STV1
LAYVSGYEKLSEAFVAFQVTAIFIICFLIGLLLAVMHAYMMGVWYYIAPKVSVCSLLTQVGDFLEENGLLSFIIATHCTRGETDVALMCPGLKPLQNNITYH